VWEKRGGGIFPLPFPKVPVCCNLTREKGPLKRRVVSEEEGAVRPVEGTTSRHLLPVIAPREEKSGPAEVGHLAGV